MNSPSIDNVIKRFKAASKQEVVDAFVWETLGEGLYKIEEAQKVLAPSVAVIAKLEPLVQKLQDVLQARELATTLKQIANFKAVFIVKAEELTSAIPQLNTIEDTIQADSEALEKWLESPTSAAPTLDMSKDLALLEKVAKVGDAAYAVLGKVRNSLGGCDEWVNLTSKLVSSIIKIFEGLPSEEDELSELTNGANDMTLAINSYLKSRKELVNKAARK